MRRLAALLAAVTLLTAGCATPRSGTLGPAPTAAPPTTPATTPAPPPPLPTTSGVRTPAPAASTTPTVDPSPSETLTLQLWFTRGGRIVPTRRTRPNTVATSALALSELAAGPSTAEAKAGLTTLLPADVDVVRIVGGTATLRPPPSLGDGDPGTVRLRRAQVVYTLTQFPTVRRVAFSADERPTGRGDYADLLAPVVVTDPAIGQRVTGPVTVAGTADVYEGTVSIRILDAAGREVGTAFTTASCGTGCRGDYRATVAYRLTATQPGTIEVYEVSPKDGSRINVVAVPVIVTASAS
jgi:hypothetical protein